MREGYRGLVLTAVAFGGLGLIYAATQLGSGEGNSPAQPTQPGLDDDKKSSLRVGFTEIEIDASPSDLPTPFATATEMSVQASRIAELESQGYECLEIIKGEWLYQKLRDSYGPGIDKGPFARILRDGTVEYYKTLKDLPSTVRRGEQFCVNKDGQSFNPSLNPHAVIFQAPSRKEFMQSAMRSTNIQTQRRSRFHY